MYFGVTHHLFVQEEKDDSRCRFSRPGVYYNSLESIVLYLIGLDASLGINLYVMISNELNLLEYWKRFMVTRLS